MSSAFGDNASGGRGESGKKVQRDINQTNLKMLSIPVGRERGGGGKAHRGWKPTIEATPTKACPLGPGGGGEREGR